MFIGKANEISRRAFLQRSSQLAAMGAASSYAMGLAGIAEAAAFSAGSDYKALVCVFLLGGNDHNNTLVPYDATNHAKYLNIRGSAANGTGVGIARSALGATALVNPAGQVLTDNLQYAFAPTMDKMKFRYDLGQLAPLLNVGPLVAPLTRAQYDSPDTVAYPRPPKLFSHNDQQSIWQSSQPEGSPTGWGGRMADLALSANTNSMFTAINAANTAVFLSGQNTVPFQLVGDGAIKIWALNGWPYGSHAAGTAMAQLISQHYGHAIGADYATACARSVQYASFVNDALAGVSLATPFPDNNNFAAQLKTVAKMIGARNQLGVKRQVFLVASGDFDNHGGLNAAHGATLGKLDKALDSFFRATKELGIENQVTTFTASDFGRTLTSNGDGSDHGWGAHHFVLGGAVNGGRFYGTAPKVSLSSNDQVGQGRLLPSTSVDEYSATLAKWFGVADSELASVAPNIGRFARRDLGFMKPVTAQSPLANAAATAA